MWGKIISWAVEFGVGSIVKYVGYALAATVLIWLWNDYQNLRGENAVQAAQIERVAETHRNEIKAGFRREEQLRADLSLQVEVSTERLARSEKQSAWIAEMNTLKRSPEHAMCPEVGPAVSFAFDRLRSDAEGSGPAD